MRAAAVVTDARQVDAAWVERALRDSGALEAGGVASIDVGEVPARQWSRMVPIKPRYSADARGERPDALLLKLCSGDFGPSEFHYYRRDYVGLADAPMPRCYAAAYADAPRRYHLLLRELSATHANGDARPADDALARSLGTSLGVLHAHRWGPRRLADIGLAPPQRLDFERWHGQMRRGVERLIERAADLVDARAAARIRALFDTAVERCAARAADSRGITLTHGDLNPGNLLVPRAPGGPVLMIDRQPFDWSLITWLGASDLVNAIVPWWDSAAQPALERTALRHYHAALVARGVDDYPFDRLLDDYRLCLVQGLGSAVGWCVEDAECDRMGWLWRAQLQRALAACERHLHAY